MHGLYLHTLHTLQQFLNIIERSLPFLSNSTRTLEVYVSPGCQMRALRSLESTLAAAIAEGVSTYSREQATVIASDGKEEVYKKFSVAIRADLDIKKLVETLRENKEVKQVAIVQEKDAGGEETDAPAVACSILWQPYVLTVV